eukprot:TRINITY_DN9686_c0_g2_i2.p3 TRINITY_DN9686_c0_g2~~TRINITY_DN9686_c0_g2_i2.p3  ORF type:complete len:148 (+),score=53.93 TRINITY_DN9686_c0_g2_i2:71-514(+)
MNFRDILLEHQRNCEEQGKFVGTLLYALLEAEIAKNRINELRQQQHAKEVEDLKSRHLSMKLEIEQAHLDEFNRFNKDWDEKMGKFEKRARKDEAGLEKKQKKDFESTTSQILSKLPDKPKSSSEVLNLEKILKNLVKQKKYVWGRV